jgi:hypothetical protein
MERSHNAVQTTNLRFRSALLNAPRVHAVVRRQDNRVVIVFSDGARRVFEHNRSLPIDEVLGSAVDWCQRRGAVTVEVVS